MIINEENSVQEEAPLPLLPYNGASIYKHQIIVNHCHNYFLLLQQIVEYPSCFDLQRFLLSSLVAKLYCAI